MGSSIVHINHLRQVYERLPVESHGLARADIDRDDRQNWRSAQRISFHKVQSCLEAQELRGSHAEGTRLYLKIVWYYAEFFCSPVASLATRIEYAAIFAIF